MAELVRVALPLVISSGSLSLMHVVDRIFLTWHSTDALAAALPAGLLNWTLISLALGTAGYVNAFVAQYEGAGEPERVAAAVWQGVYFSLLATVVMLMLVPLAPWMFRMFGHERAVQALEIEYFSILCLGAGPMVLSGALACFYSGRGQTEVIMLVNVISSLTNVVLDYVMIFGSFGFPEMGIRGAAIATVIANCVGLGLYAAIMIFGRDGRRYGLWPAHRPDGELFRRLLRYGLPNGFNMFIDVAFFTFFVQVVGAMGTEQLAATNLAFNLNALAFIPMLGFGTAVMTLTGQRIGEGQPALAVRTTWLAFAIAGTYMSAFGAIYVLAPGWVLLPYAAFSDPGKFAGVESHVATLLKFIAVFSLFDAMAIIFSSSIRGAGDTRFALLFTMACSLTLMVVPTYVGFHYFGAGLNFAWASVTVFIIALGVGFMIRFHRGRWQSMSVIEPARVEQPDSPVGTEQPAIAG